MERVDKEKNTQKGTREKIMEIVKKAGDSDNYETSWSDEGVPVSKKKSNVKRGKSSRAKGARFELKVRKDLEEKGKIVDKWNNNVNLEEDKVIIAKKKFNPFSKAMTLGTGFPDFITIKQIHEGAHRVIGVEVKMNGMLSKIEKEKCAWYLQKGVFSQIWIAKAVKKGRKVEIEYYDFFEKYGNKYNKT